MKPACYIPVLLYGSENWLMRLPDSLASQTLSLPASEGVASETNCHFSVLRMRIQ